MTDACFLQKQSVRPLHAYMDSHLSSREEKDFLDQRLATLPSDHKGLPLLLLLLFQADCQINRSLSWCSHRYQGQLLHNLPRSSSWNSHHGRFPTFEGSDHTRSLRMCSRGVDFQAPYSATVVDRFISEGAVMMGKTSLDEFGMGSTNAHCALLPPTINPWSLLQEEGEAPFSPGGSSGGSAVAVASYSAFA